MDKLSKDLLFINTVRENMERAKAKAEELFEDNEIDGVILSFHVVDVPKDPANQRRNHRFIHTEFEPVGFCASEDFEKSFLHRASDYHKILMHGNQRVVFGKWSKAEAATKRIERPLNDESNIDAFFAVWGADTIAPNQELLQILVANL